MKNMNQRILGLCCTGIFLFSSMLVYSYVNPAKAVSAAIPNMIQNGTFTQWTSNSSTSPITYDPLYWGTVHANYTQSNGAGSGQPVIFWNLTTPDISQNYGGCNLNGYNNGYGDIEGTDNFSCGIYQGNLGQLSSYTNVSLDWDITINAFNPDYFQPGTTPMIALGLSIDNNTNTGYIQPTRPFPFSILNNANANLVSPSGAYEVDYIWHTTCIDPSAILEGDHFTDYQSVLYGGNFTDVKDFDTYRTEGAGIYVRTPTVPIGTSVHYKIFIDVPDGMIQYFYNNARIYAVQDANIYTGNIFVEAFDYGVSEYTISNITLTANTPSVAEYNPPVTVLTVMIPLAVVAALVVVAVYVRRRKPSQ